MEFTCSNPKCNHNQFGFIAFNFAIPNNQARSAYAIECKKCKNIQDIIRIAPAQIQRQDPNEIKKHLDTIDDIAYKVLYEKLLKEFTKMNLKVIKKNSMGDLAIEPINPNKLTGLVELNAQLVAKNSNPGVN